MLAYVEGLQLSMVSDADRVRQLILNGVILILVRPNAPRTEIVGYDESRGALKVAVAAPPEDNKANKEVVRFFTKLLKKKVFITHGLASRKKQLKIEDKP